MTTYTLLHSSGPSIFFHLSMAGKMARAWSCDSAELIRVELKQDKWILDNSVLFGSYDAPPARMLVLVTVTITITVTCAAVAPAMLIRMIENASAVNSRK